MSTLKYEDEIKYLRQCNVIAPRHVERSLLALIHECRRPSVIGPSVIVNSFNTISFFEICIYKREVAECMASNGYRSNIDPDLYNDKEIIECQVYHKIDLTQIYIQRDYSYLDIALKNIYTAAKQMKALQNDGILPKYTYIYVDITNYDIEDMKENTIPNFYGEAKYKYENTISMRYYIEHRLSSLQNANCPLILSINNNNMNNITNMKKDPSTGISIGGPIPISTYIYGISGMSANLDMIDRRDILDISLKKFKIGDSHDRVLDLFARETHLFSHTDLKSLINDFASRLINMYNIGESIDNIYIYGTHSVDQCMNAAAKSLDGYTPTSLRSLTSKSVDGTYEPYISEERKKYIYMSDTQTDSKLLTDDLGVVVGAQYGWNRFVHNPCTFSPNSINKFIKQYKSGLEKTRCILISGASGLGKTSLTKAIATQLELPILRIFATSLRRSRIGSTEENFKNIFDDALLLSPCILVIENAELVLAPARVDVDWSHWQHIHIKRIFYQYLVKMKKNGNIIVLTTTVPSLEISVALNKVQLLILDLNPVNKIYGGIFDKKTARKHIAIYIQRNDPLDKQMRSIQEAIQPDSILIYIVKLFSLYLNGRMAISAEKIYIYSKEISGWFDKLDPDLSNLFKGCISTNEEKNIYTYLQVLQYKILVMVLPLFAKICIYNAVDVWNVCIKWFGSMIRSSENILQESIVKNILQENIVKNGVSHIYNKTTDINTEYNNNTVDIHIGDDIANCDVDISIENLTKIIEKNME